MVPDAKSFPFSHLCKSNICATFTRKSIPVQQLSEGIRLLLSSYTKAVNKRFGKNGSMFQQKTKSKNIYDGERNYGEQAFHYIHQNPVPKIVTTASEWEFSSYKDYAGIRKGNLCNKQLAEKLLNIDMTNFEKYSNGFMNLNIPDSFLS